MKKTQWFKIFILLTAISLFAVGCSKKEEDQQAKDQPVPVVVSKVEKKTVEDQSRYIGSTKASQDVMVFSKVTGKVQQLNVKVGDTVKAGQVLLKVDTTDLSYSVRQANASYQAALDNLNRAKDAKEQAEEQVKQAEKAVSPLKPDSQAAVQQAKSALQQAEANVEAVQAQVNQTKIGVDQANNTVAEANVKAPIAGVVSSIMVDKGDMAAPQSPVIQIVNADTITVQLNSVTETSLKNFTIGKEVVVNVPSLSKELKGTVASIAQAANPQTLTFPIEIKVENKDKAMKPGMLAEVILTKSTSEQLVIPTNAVVGTGDEAHVFVIEKGKAKKKPVKIKEMATEETSIEGLNENEQIIIKGQYLVADGSTVKITTEEGKS